MSTEVMTSAPAFCGRLSWMIVGPFALAVCTIGIIERHGGWFSPLDLIYFIILGGMALGRWAEFHYGQPLTATGEPATAAQTAPVCPLVGHPRPRTLDRRQCVREPGDPQPGLRPVAPKCPGCQA